MKEKYSKSIMASYATFKELYKSQKYKSPYQILSEFIKYTIVSKSLYSFTATDIQCCLNEEFGFNPPIAVIKSAIKNIPEVVLDNNRYSAIDVQGDKHFQTYKDEADLKNKTINNALILFAEKNHFNNLDKNKLSEELIAFVLDEEGDSQYQQVIGEFVLENENNDQITSAISTIREGSILYSGLAFNISEFGSLKQPLTLFLDTEIIFDIVGLNGVLYKTLADEFLKLVSIANKGERIITLKYFSKVEEDIEQYFSRAESIVEGHGEINFSNAMREITEGCKDISDVSDKKIDLYRKLSYEYGIQKDEKTDYYTTEDVSYNLGNLGLEDYSEEDPINYEGYLFCNNINKLRKGKQTTDYFSSKYICITDTRRVLEISRAIIDDQKRLGSGDKNCDYAVNLNHITNLLWYKLNNGFGSKHFPQNLDVIIKARTILSGYITQGISSTYKDIRNKVEAGELSQELAAARIVALKEKAALPEQLDNNNIKDSLDFTENYFSQFEETLAQNRKLLSERDRTIKELSNNLDDLKGLLSQSNEENREKQRQIDNLTERVRAIEKKENEIRIKNNKRKAIFVFILSIIWKIIAIVVSVFLIWIICKIFKIDFPTWLGITIGVVSCILSVIPFLKKDIRKCKEKIEEQ